MNRNTETTSPTPRKRAKHRWRGQENTLPTLEMPRQIVINRSYGGFCLSERAKTMYKEATKDIPRHANWYINQDVPRDDPILIRIVTELGLKASAGTHANLKIIEIPDDVPADGWIIQDYDGLEWVAEKHRTWSA
jgi:hypothetical protein